MYERFKRLFGNGGTSSIRVSVGRDSSAPITVVTFVGENGKQFEVPLDINWRAGKIQPNEPPSRLLHWRRRLTDLLGRDDELAALKAWAQGGAEASQAQVIVGDGGVGKTRLAMELADWLRVNQHWRAGALPDRKSVV